MLPPHGLINFHHFTHLSSSSFSPVGLVNLRKFYWVMYDVSCGAILERKNASVLTGSHFSQPKPPSLPPSEGRLREGMAYFCEEEGGALGMVVLR